jgi:hypothetical protein
MTKDGWLFPPERSSLEMDESVHPLMKDMIENILKLQTLEFNESATPETKSQMAQLRAKVPPQILGHYDRLVARGKKGVALIRGEVCSACHMQVPRSVVLTVLRGEDIQLCGNCGRYLYLPPQAEEAGEPARQQKSKRKRTAPLQTA